jgi:hypothetical protein
MGGIWKSQYGVPEIFELCGPFRHVGTKTVVMEYIIQDMGKNGKLLTLLASIPDPFYYMCRRDICTGRQRLALIPK